MFFKILIIIFAISYFFPKILRFGLKLFINTQVNKAQSEYQNQSRQQKNHRQGVLIMICHPVILHQYLLAPKARVKRIH